MEGNKVTSKKTKTDNKKIPKEVIEHLDSKYGKGRWRVLSKKEFVNIFAINQEIRSCQ